MVIMRIGKWTRTCLPCSLPDVCNWLDGSCGTAYLMLMVTHSCRSTVGLKWVVSRSKGRRWAGRVYISHTVWSMLLQRWTSELHDYFQWAQRGSLILLAEITFQRFLLCGFHLFSDSQCRIMESLMTMMMWQLSANVQWNLFSFVSLSSIFVDVQWVRSSGVASTGETRHSVNSAPEVIIRRKDIVVRFDWLDCTECVVTDSPATFTDVYWV